MPIIALVACVIISLTIKGDSMEVKSISEEIKEEKQYLKEATALLEDEDDISYFKEHERWLQSGQLLADTDEKKMLVRFQLSDLRNKITFLLFRLGKLTPELEAKFRAMDSIEDIRKSVESYGKEREERQNVVKKQVEELRAEENAMDIFKAVCSGMSEEDAKKQLADYEAQIQKAVQGK